MVIVNEHDNHDRQRLDSSLVYIGAHNVYYVKSCLSDAKCFSGSRYSFRVLTPVGAAGGVVIKAGEVIARIHMYKIATLGSGNPRNFTWNIISNNNVVMPTGGCTVDSRNVTVDLPDFPGSAEIPLGVYCSSEQKLSFYLSGATTDSSRQVFANTAPDATKASGVGVTLMRNGKILATGENVSLGTVNKSKVPLGLSATYGQTGNKVSAGTVQSVIGVTFIYE